MSDAKGLELERVTALAPELIEKIKSYVPSHLYMNILITESGTVNLPKNTTIRVCAMGGGGGSWQLQDGRTSHYWDSRLHGGGSGFLSSGKLMVPESGKVGFK